MSKPPMDAPFVAPPSTPFLQTLAGLQPKILQEEGLFLRMSCLVCETPYLIRKSQYAWNRAKGTQTGLTCSPSCGRKRWHLLNPGASVFNRMPPEQRGKPKGVVRSEAYKRKMSESHKAKGLKPTVRGGNGTGMTEAEKVVRTALPDCWIWNYPVALGKRQPGYPTNYKLDFADPKTKRGLEVDGGSHGVMERKLQDRKKETKLAELGWTVFRVSNAEVRRLSTTSRLKAHLTTLLKVR